MIKTAAVPSSPTAFVEYNVNRIALLIKAPSTNAGVIYIKIDSSPAILSAANGYQLNPGEGIPISIGRTDGRANPLPNALIAMSTNGTDQLHVTELSFP